MAATVIMGREPAGWCAPATVSKALAGSSAPCEASAWIFVAAHMGTDKLCCAARVMLEEGAWCHAQRSDQSRCELETALHHNETPKHAWSVVE